MIFFLAGQNLPGSASIIYNVYNDYCEIIFFLLNILIFFLIIVTANVLQVTVVKFVY